jgi:hypothetical protein
MTLPVMCIGRCRETSEVLKTKTVLGNEALMREKGTLHYEIREASQFDHGKVTACIDIVSMRKCMCGVRFRSESHYLELRLTNGLVLTQQGAMRCDQTRELDGAEGFSGF